ncbi:MAG: lysoplasmalogenase [Woeseiaceae bacterium]|nr:lysoplasmalogenase [Woeseiaceae bacterium]
MTALPDSALVVSGALLAITVAALLWAERKCSRLGIWLAKPLASTLFVITAILAGALASPYGRIMLVGLVLSWLGDVLLIPRRQRFFVAGLASFLLAHVAYSAAFFLEPLAVLPLSLGAIAMAVFAVIIVRWLWPHLPRNLRAAVAAYVAAISLMVVLAAGTTAAHGFGLLIGALMFAVSDVFVARDRFVSASVTNRFWGLPLYYSAQLVFALSTQVSG